MLACRALTLLHLQPSTAPASTLPLLFSGNYFCVPLLNRPLGLEPHLTPPPLLCTWVLPPHHNSKIWPACPSQHGRHAPPGELLQVQGRVLAEHTRLLTGASEAVAAICQELRGLSTIQQTQAEQLSALDTLVNTLTHQVSVLASQVSTLSARISPVPERPVSAPPQPGLAAAVAPPPVAPPDRGPHLAAPALYDGTFALCREFLMQCEYVFELQPSMYSTAAARIAYIANLTTGRACRWVMAGREGSAAYMQDYTAFVAEFRAVFDHNVHGQDAAVALSALQQGSSSVADYATEFRILAARCAWNKPAMYSMFRRGLGEAMKDALSGRERPTTLNQLISLSITLDERYRERKRQRAHQHQVSTKPSSSPSPSLVRPVPVASRPQTPTGEEPMQLGRARLTPTEREHLHGPAQPLHGQPYLVWLHFTGIMKTQRDCKP